MKPSALSLALLASLLFAAPSKGDAAPVDDFVIDASGLGISFSLPESPTPDFADSSSFSFNQLIATASAVTTDFRVSFDTSISQSWIIIQCGPVQPPHFPGDFCDFFGIRGVVFTGQQFFLGPPNSPTFIPGTYIHDFPPFTESLTITREAPETSALTLLACGLAFLLCYHSLARRSV